MHGRHHDSKSLRAALALTATFFGVELIGGWLANSLALLSDAAHMFTDAGALTLGLFALWVAGRPPSESKTYGYYRAEILAALLNGLVLSLVVCWIVYEAYHRWQDPPPVRSGLMLMVAMLGMLVNLACAWLLRPREGASLNLRAAFLHVLADLLGSLGALIAAVIMKLTGWYAADSAAAFFIAVLILIASWGLIREALDILMEAVPPHVNLERLRSDLESVSGAEKVHDLHVWTLTTGQYALSAHAVIDGTVDGERVLQEMRNVLANRFHIDHVTIQLERTQPCEPESVHV
jgi:cobalt-zinc-cadmium efflux system protein